MIDELARTAYEAYCSRGGEHCAWWALAERERDAWRDVARAFVDSPGQFARVEGYQAGYAAGHAAGLQAGCPDAN